MRLSVVIVFCLLAAGLAFADTVVLKDGGKVVGKVTVTRTEVVVNIRPGMTVSFPKDQVKQIVFEKTPREEFEERFKKLAADETAGFYSLGLWAKEEGLKEEAKQCFEKVVELEPDHTGARKELGHVRHEGKWLPYEEAMKVRGLVKHRGRWVTPEAKEKLEKAEQAAKIKKEVHRLISLISGTDRARAERVLEKYLKVKDPLAVPALEKGAKHHKAYMRFLTVKVYGNFKPELVTKPLVKLAVSDKDERVRAEAVNVLREIKSPTAYVGMLKNFYYSPNGDVRLQAMDALGALKDKNSVAPLIESVAYEVRRVVSIPTGTPDTFVGTQSRKVIGYRKIIDSFGRVVDVPIIGNVTSGYGSGGTTRKLVHDIIFNLGARLALKEITGQDFNYDKKEWREWWKKNKDKFGPFMELKKKKEESKDK
jgi:hypothetical protein